MMVWVGKDKLWGGSGDKRRIKRVWRGRRQHGGPGDGRDTGIIGDLQQEHKSTWEVRAERQPRAMGHPWGSQGAPLSTPSLC